MTKNVTLLGASYPDVPSILLPQTGGGSAEFYADKGSWEGKNLEFVQEFTPIHWTLDDTSYSTWTPSTTQQIIKNYDAYTTFVADMVNYEYAIKYFTKVTYAYLDGSEDKMKMLVSYYSFCNYLFRYPSTESYVYGDSYNGNTTSYITISGFSKYLNTNGYVRFDPGVGMGIYVATVSIPTSSSTSATPTATVRTPILYAKCNTSSFSVTNAEKIDTANTTIDVTMKLYRCPRFDCERSEQLQELIAQYCADNPPSRNIRQGEEEETEEPESDYPVNER